MSNFEAPAVEKTFDREKALEEFKAIFNSPEDGDVLYFLDASSATMALGTKGREETLKTNGFKNMDDLWKKIESYEESMVLILIV